MGYDLTRFEGQVDEELICYICAGVLQEPLQSPNCEHTFCGFCIKEWLSHNNTCPVDRQRMQISELKTASRLLNNLLSKLKIGCDYTSFGCKTIVKLDSLSMHCNVCDFNPKKGVNCDWGCGLIMPKDELNRHNCVKALRLEVQEQSNLILNMQQELQFEQQQHKQQLNQLEEELREQKQLMENLQELLKVQLEEQEQDERDERWANEFRNSIFSILSPSSTRFQQNFNN